MAEGEIMAKKQNITQRFYVTRIVYTGEIGSLVEVENSGYPFFSIHDFFKWYKRNYYDAEILSEKYVKVDGEIHELIIDVDNEELE